MSESKPITVESRFPQIYRDRLNSVQVNLGYRCNQACHHCHVDAGPKRTEEMELETVDAVLDFIRQYQITTLDLTGGAPELNPHFRYLVREARELECSVIDRCNLTIVFEPQQQDLVDFLHRHRVQVTASLPCYLESNVDAQRGKGVFDKSIRALQWFNQKGFGLPDSEWILNLVYNPQGAQLPPNQQSLERDYKYFLREKFGIQFNQLLTITNMPIQRFEHQLAREQQLESYHQLLQSNYQANNLDGLMCRRLISVDWRGYVHDCDFNQMLQWPLGSQSTPIHIRELNAATLEYQPIAVGRHCYACTAGQGSSCGGALNEVGKT